MLNVVSFTRFAQRALGTRQVNQLIRYAPVLRHLDGLPGGSLLDVGSGSTGIRPLVRDRWKVVSLDSDFGDFGALVTGTDTSTWLLGDALRLPFPDGSFHVVVAVDLLEHMTDGSRGAAVDELCRVASRRAIIACPTGMAAWKSDRRIRDRLLARGATVPGWLDEHLLNGFPERADLARRAGRHGAVATSGNESATAHERVTMAELRFVSAVPLRIAARVLARGLTARLNSVRDVAAEIVFRVGGHDREPTYRSVLCIDVESRHIRE